MIHILIERHIANGMDSTYDDLAKTALQRSHGVEGFISGEAFIDSQDSGRRLVFCKWRTQQDWKRWRHSKERLELTNRFSSVLEQPEKVTVLLS